MGGMDWELLSQILLLLFILYFLITSGITHYFLKRSETYTAERKAFKEQKLYP